MASPTASGDPDSTTSSIGRKRGYEEFVTFEARPDGVESVSAEDYDAQLQKRRRHDSSKEAPLRTPSIEQFKPPIELAKNFTGVAGSGNVSRHSQNQVQVAISPAITWNQGIPIPIRTSFGTSAPQKQPQSYQPPLVQRQSAAQDIPAVGRTSVQATEVLLTEETVNASALSNPQMYSAQKFITDAVQNPRPGEVRIKNHNWRWIFTEADILIADTLIGSLPERQRDLMPRQISNDSLSFKDKGCRFVLGRIDVSLREICFVQHQKTSFVLHFLKRNSAVLESINYSVLASAFIKHMEYFYGHLPKILVSLVSKNKRIKSKGTKAQCAKAISDAKNMSRKLRANKAEGEMGLDGCELKSSSNQETRPNIRSNGQADEIQNPNSSTNNSRNGSNVQPQTVSTNERMADVTTLEIPPHSDPATESVKNGSDIHPGFYAPINESNMDTGVMMDAICAVEFGLTAESRNVPKKNAPARSGTGVDGTELELFYRYYPADGTDPSIPRCLTCSDLEHRSSDCPLLTCATCGLRGIHFTEACPQSQRCARCRNRGHDKSKCPEKLAATSSEMNCDLCQSKNHLEDRCHFLWRSFRPDSLRQKRLLEDIPVYCYCCGTNTHFGPECGIRSTPLYAEGWTWSRANWERYVDVKGNKRVFDLGKRQMLKNVLSIKSEETHELISLDVDDDVDDVEFISQKVKIPPPPVNKGKQKIKFINKKNNEESFIPRPDLRPARPGPRQQLPRASKMQRHPDDRDADYFNSYRPSNDESSRDYHARSVPPSRVNVRDQYGDMSYRPDYDRDVPPFRGYSDGRRGGDVSRGRESRGGIAKGFGGRGSGKRGGGSTRAERRKKKEARMNQAAS